jgi:hypothetical protein
MLDPKRNDVGAGAKDMVSLLFGFGDTDDAVGDLYEVLVTADEAAEMGREARERGLSLTQWLNLLVIPPPDDPTSELKARFLS